MSLTETVLEGTILVDGTLELDHKPNLPPGRVTVVLRQMAPIELPKDDPFWQRMQAMWSIRDSQEAKTTSGEDTVAELNRMREEWDERQQRIERLQEESREQRRAQEESKP